MPENVLLRRLTLWVLFALTGLEALAFLLIGALMSQYFEHKLGGKPLPVLTQWIFHAAYGGGVLPGLAFVLAMIFVVGMILPLIPIWCGMVSP